MRRPPGGRHGTGCRCLGLLLLCAGTTLTAIASEAGRRDVRVDDGGWTLTSTGRFDSWVDQRALLVLHHPWEESAADQGAAATREIALPDGWQAPVRLHFYMSDDFRSDQAALAEGWLGQIKLVGHRFKQVLVNGQVVWERDVADANTADQPTRFAIALPDAIRPGDAVRIGFRLHDKVGSNTRLPEDHRRIGETDGIPAESPWRFHTTVYIGDVMLTSGDAPGTPTTPMPSAARVREVHARRWPLPPISAPTAFPVQLRVQGSQAGPLHCGVPLPAGAVQVTDRLQLQTAHGTPLPIDYRPMNYWPDNRVRWLEVGSVLPPGERTETVLLDIAAADARPAHPASPVVVAQASGAPIRVGNGAVEVHCAPVGDPLQLRLATGSGLLDALTGSLRAGNATYIPMVEGARVLDEGPVRALVEQTGTLRDGAHVYGRFVARLEVFAGLPYAHVTWRVFYEQSGTAQVSAVTLTGAFDAGPARTYFWNTGQAAAGAPIHLANVTEESARLELDSVAQAVPAGTSANWLGIAGSSATLATFHYRGHEQYPNAITYDGSRLSIVLFEPTESVPHYTPHEGEAKRFDLWIGLWDHAVAREELERVLATWAVPARLFAADYFCAAGGFGHAFPHDAERFPRLNAYMEATYGAQSERAFFATGVRHWGDLIYDHNAGTWRNGYYDRQQGFAAEFLMTGAAPWYRRLEAAVRHIIHVDVCHHSAEHPDSVGSIHGYYEPDHSTAPPWNAMQRTKGTLAYWRYSCDRDARDAALAVADSAIVANRGIGASSVRDHAGILYCLTAAYDETRDVKYLEAARRLAHDTHHRIDPRRGTYIEIHGNTSYAGNVPWMVAQLMEPLYDYYRQSGDVEAAVTLVGLADSILAENTTRGIPGDIWGYSHNPHFKKTSNYHVLIAPALMYAYELTEDSTYLEHARAMYEQTLAENSVNDISNCYWNTPTLLYYLHKLPKGPPGTMP